MWPKSPLARGRQREDLFRRRMVRRGIVLTRDCQTFRFTRTTYRPDFYDPGTKVFYEVVGTRQRAQQLTSILDLMELVYPHVIVKAMTPRGMPYPFRLARRVSKWKVPFAHSLQEALDRKGWRIRDLAMHLAVTPPSLSCALVRAENNYLAIQQAAEAWLTAQNGDGHAA